LAFIVVNLAPTMGAVLDWIRATYDPQTIFWGWGAIVLSMVAIHAAEIVLPAQRDQRYRAIGFNVVATAAFLALGPIASFLPGYLVTAAVKALHGPWFQADLPNLLPESGWSRIGLLIVFAFVPLLVSDFFYYWFHRLQHANRWLWEQHKLHHTDEAVNVTTSLRHHWTENGFRLVFVALPMGATLTITPVEAGIVTMFTSQWGYLIHANIRLPLGPLSGVFLGPQAHRIHHSLEREHLNKNFAAFFPIWDILFGTFHRPRLGEFPDTGVAGEIGRPAPTNAVWPFHRVVGDATPRSPACLIVVVYMQTVRPR
jgi:sterol desaturase/sphingolipid hydroxylase (fatty acid hydroxylase superfamily)